MSARALPATQLVRLSPGADLGGFRRAVRHLVVHQIPPRDVAWTIEDEPELFGGDARSDPAPALALPRAVASLVPQVVPHRDPERYALLYDLIWRSLGGERALIEVASDPLVHRLQRMAKTIRRDLHKMHAFLRFREIPGEDRFVAWFEPDHFILEAAAPFFVERFRSLRWTILTPIGSTVWDRETLRFGPPGRREDAPSSDPFEAGWLGYYESTFNPARTNLEAMRAEVPKKYWKNLPEARTIPRLVASAAARRDAMIESEPQMPRKRDPKAARERMFDQDFKSLAELNAAIAASEPLVPGAERAVLGEGPTGAAIAFVGEQPGDQEDVEGRPFVGPAGQLLTRALGEAGIVRSDVYLTNAVKHFKFEQRGKRRIHQSPTAGEIRHYRPWLIREIELVRPKLVVALGASALHALAGKAMPIGKNRGPLDWSTDYHGFVTVHPSYLLRLPDEAARREAYGAFVEDLRQLASRADALAG